MVQQSHLLANGMQWAWDATSLQAAMTCPMKYKLSILDSWQPARKSRHLVFGGHYAKALERFHKYRAEGQSYDDATENCVHECLIDSWEYDTDAEGLTRTGGRPWDSMDTAKNRETLIRSIVWYLEAFKDETLETVRLENGQAAVELSFTVELNDKYVYCGHMDRVVTNGPELYVLDQKTTGHTITPNFFDGFTPDVQMTGYTFAGRAVFHKPIRGVIVDGAQIAVGFTRFERGFINRTDGDIEEWLQDLFELINRFEGYAETGVYPKNRMSCGNYGGCEFRRICSRDKSNREAFLRGDFDKRESAWNPLERR